jgi:hypothetical protein
MTVKTQQHPRRTRSLRPHLGRTAKQPPVAGPADQVAAAPPSGARERDAGGPEDHALYHCHCGYVFQASVSTTVGCPNCGGAQAW